MVPRLKSMSVSESPVTGRPRGTARARGREETRRRLIEAGTELFARDGLHGTTSARIARAAGVATGTFYLHFKDKQALFRHIVFAALAELRERMARAMAGERDLAGRLRARTAEVVGFAAENRSLILVLFGPGHEAADLGEAVLGELVPGIEEGFREYRKRGEVATELDPAVAAQALAAMTTRVIAWWVEDPERATRQDVIETLLRMHPVYFTRND